MGVGPIFGILRILRELFGFETIWSKLRRMVKAGERPEYKYVEARLASSRLKNHPRSILALRIEKFCLSRLGKLCIPGVFYVYPFVGNHTLADLG